MTDQKSTLSFLEWDEHDVKSWLSRQGFEQYAQLILDEGITGDALPYLDPPALQDLGIDKLGHRLSICKAIYNLKVELTMAAAEADPEDGLVGWDWTEEDWRPADEGIPHHRHPMHQASQSTLSSLLTTPSQAQLSHSQALSPTALSFMQMTHRNGSTGNLSLDGVVHTHSQQPQSQFQAQSQSSLDKALEDRLWDVIQEQNERIANLEREYRRLAAAVAGTSKDRGLQPEARNRERSTDKHEDETNTVRTQAAVSRMQPYRARPGEESRLGDSHTPALSPGFQDYPPSDPATSTAPVPLSRGIATSGTHATPPSLTRMMTTTTMIGSGVDGHGHSHSQSHTNNPSGLTLSSPNLGSSQASTPVPTGTSEHIQSLGVRTPASALLRSATTSHRTTPGTALAPTSAETPVSHASGASHQDKQVISASAQKSAKDAAGAAAKSFRVTLEDPCFKVLPAALKKYNINDDWRMYAMFICYGDTGESNRTSDNRSGLRLILASFRFNVIERCLSYDEMPLLLFQKLKESGQKPVFMLRHIKDIRSPTAIAASKQASRKGKPPAEGGANASNDPSKPGTSPTTATKSAGSDTRLHRPPVLQPISAKAKAAGTGSNAAGSGKTTPGSAGHGAFPDLPSPGLRGPLMGQAGEQTDGNRDFKKIGYAVAIYPYAAEREDEFDVVIGTAFVILSKAKGWWVVQKDGEGTGDIVVDDSQSGWVPAGCLLETNRPIGPPATRVAGDLGALAKQPIPPSYIVSSSFQGVALMQYDAKGEDELSMRKDEQLRVFKRYAHWSYSVKETGERGWVPSWFVGKRGPEGSSSNSSGTAKAVEGLAGGESTRHDE